MWRRRRWVSLLNLIDRLPRNSHFQEALANDEEYAKQVAAVEAEHGQEQAVEWRPAMSTYSPEVEVSILVANKLESLVVMVDNFMGGKAQPNYIKGPRTAIDEYRSSSYLERRKRNHQKLVARLLPNGPQKLPKEGKAEPPVG